MIGASRRVTRAERSRSASAPCQPAVHRAAMRPANPVAPSADSPRVGRTEARRKTRVSSVSTPRMVRSVATSRGTLSHASLPATGCSIQG